MKNITEMPHGSNYITEEFYFLFKQSPSPGILLNFPTFLPLVIQDRRTNMHFTRYISAGT